MSSSVALFNDKSKVPLEFNRIAWRYDLATKLSQGYQKDLELSVERMKLNGNEYGADFCCGTGKSTEALLSKITDGKILGIDNSSEMLNHANQKFKDEIQSGRVEFIQKDVMKIDFKEKFDVIFMAYGIRNMPDYKKAVKILFKALKPGGKICFHEYSLNDNIFAKLYWIFLGHAFIIPIAGFISGSFPIFRYLIKSVRKFLSPSQFKNLLEENGFKDVMVLPLSSWRNPILKTFIAVKPGKDI
jgi:ubiquinone/menaquinone biosynthesis methyltransferase